MNIDDFLVSEKPHERQVTMPDGSQETLYFLEPTAADIRRWQITEMGNDEEKRLYAMQELIAACLYDNNLKRKVFEGVDFNQSKKLSYKACDCFLTPILDMAGILRQKKA